MAVSVRRFWMPALLALAWMTLSGAALAQDTPDYFKRNCATCHSIGGVRKVGPDLKNVTARRDRAWLVRFMQNPAAMKDSGDADAVKLFADFPNSTMPTLLDLNEDRCESILKLIETESKLDRSQFAGAEAFPNRPFTADEMEKGREFFVGGERFTKGGAPCLACHSVAGVSAIGGGKLGPDLTQVFNRLGGRNGLNGWLTEPPTPTMKPIYAGHPLSDDERKYLIAYLEKAKEGREEITSGGFNFFLIGLAGTVLGFVVLDYLWRSRFRDVRQTLVHDGDKKA